MPGREFKYPLAEHLSLSFTRSLVELTGLNEFMGSVLPVVASTFGTDRLSLVDYYENTNRFALIHFEGYPSGSRYVLQRRFAEMELSRAKRNAEPYQSRENPRLLSIPLYFREILEAVVVLESEQPITLTPELLEAAEVISRFLGLFMSSSRLEVNREQAIDFDDLKRARQIQLNFLPRQYPSRPTCEVYGYNNSSNMVGGDYFDYFQKHETSVQCILADACGHGLAAALIMSNFRGLLQSTMAREIEFRRLFDHLNQQVHFEEELIQYLTGIFLNLDEGSRRLEYLNAGHYEPLVFNAGGQVRSLPGGGPPLGMFKESTYQIGETSLEPGDLVVLYTDGLVDIEDHSAAFFGTEGIVKSVMENLHHPLGDIAHGVMDTARQFQDSHEFEDDITLFLMRVR